MNRLAQLLLLLLFCHSTNASQGVTYHCDSDIFEPLQLHIDLDGSALLFSSQDGKLDQDNPRIMFKQKTARGFHYSAIDIEVFGVEDKAILYHGLTGRAEYCNKLPDDGLDYSGLINPSTKPKIYMYSLGGKVRSGPGIQFQQVDSLGPMSPIYGYERINVLYQGYPWFRIDYQDGQSGYQWGGILCMIENPIRGIYHSCD